MLGGKELILKESDVMIKSFGNQMKEHQFYIILVQNKIKCDAYKTKT